jgi:YVTN family beta-propeller protein
MSGRLPALFKYIPELTPDRLRTHLERLWKRKINPPPERSIFTSPEKSPVTARQIAEVQTSAEPKQVSYAPASNLLIVTCMRGKVLQLYSIRENYTELEDEIQFEHQCVEVVTQGNLAFVTTTNFERPPRKVHNQLHIIDIEDRRKVSSVNTLGNWSKFIAPNPNKKEVLVSNWHSHSVSVIDIQNVRNPTVIEVIKWGESPRGIAVTQNGREAIITGFYSGNIGVLEKDCQGNWKITHTSPPFDEPNYAGNPRHVLVDEKKQIAYISNLGRNLLHIWSITERQFIDSITVGKSPNTIAFLDQDNCSLAVSCRESDRVYFINADEKRITGISEKTKPKPTGLCSLPGGEIAVTCFGSNTLARYKITDN